MARADFSDKTAIITGGGRGIGKAIAFALGEAGAKIVITGRNGDTLNSACEELKRKNIEAKGITCDVGVEDEVLSLFDKTEEYFAAPDIIVNNAGIGIFKPVAQMPVEEWDSVVTTNLRGAFLCCREAVRRFGETGGRIVNIASVVGLKGYAEQGAYTASKHGLMGLTKVLALEGQKKNVIVQAVCPGGVDTEMIDSARPDLDRSGLMQPQDIADAVMFLLGQTGNAITDYLSLRRRGSTPFAV